MVLSFLLPGGLECGAGAECKSRATPALILNGVVEKF